MVPNKYSVNELIRNHSFNRWVRGQASEEERYIWDQWIMNNPANRVYAMKAQEKIVGFSLDPGEDASTDEAWHSLQHQIGGDSDTRIYKCLTYKRFKSNKLNWIARVAAIFILISTSVYVSTHIYQTPDQTIDVVDFIETKVSTDYGEQKTVRFSDGSEIILNGNSSLVSTKNSSNPASFDLYMTGEAYLSISKREFPDDTPFQIRTDDGIVEVLGTQLVISTRHNRTRVFLDEGRVAVHPFHLDSETVLAPSQLVEFSNKSHFLETRFVKPEIYISWINGQLHFEQATVDEVLNRIEETFGVKTVVRDTRILDQKISGSIDSSELEIITSALSEMLNISIQKSDSENVIYIGGNALE